MKIKIYPEIGNQYFVFLPQNVRTEDEVESWLNDHARNVAQWEPA